ncbi:uncharacterized protein LOC126612375 isoform X1 [Malus sylvestris]|uniref:uncharacterized protein LOC126612375 isoform X1 n=1 Tax=Malus sylvestris TaxID=3752 RepID=UPI0021ACA60A|nr:uncharacterized protein LOC126612375 isoform X1 [Malus sylvestris]XP_050136742.1 uncharacterized protein LOC126612375 isoform X1 [Malus sylvestris]
MVRERNSEGGRDGGADFRFLLQICSVKPVGYNSISSPFPLNEKFETYNSISSLLGFPLYSSPGGSFSPYDSISHDLPLQHPNFAFVNCQRKTKYEEIIGDCVGFGHEGYQQLVPPYSQFYGPDLVMLLSDCGNCSSLPPVGQLPALKELYVEGMKVVKSVGVELYGGNQPFQCLEKLKFREL